MLNIISAFKNLKPQRLASILSTDEYLKEHSDWQLYEALQTRPCGWPLVDPPPPFGRPVGCSDPVLTRHSARYTKDSEEAALSSRSSGREERERRKKWYEKHPIASKNLIKDRFCISCQAQPTKDFEMSRNVSFMFWWPVDYLSQLCYKNVCLSQEKVTINKYIYFLFFYRLRN